MLDSITDVIVSNNASRAHISLMAVFVCPLGAFSKMPDTCEKDGCSIFHLRGVGTSRRLYAMGRSHGGNTSGELSATEQLRTGSCDAFCGIEQLDAGRYDAFCGIGQLHLGRCDAF